MTNLSDYFLHASQRKSVCLQREFVVFAQIRAIEVLKYFLRLVKLTLRKWIFLVFSDSSQNCKKSNEVSSKVSCESKYGWSGILYRATVSFLLSWRSSGDYQLVWVCFLASNWKDFPSKKLYVCMSARTRNIHERSSLGRSCLCKDWQ